MYGDFCTGEIFSLNNGVQIVLMDTDLMSISSFGEVEAGEIYVVGLEGTVHRIINPNASPTDPPSAAVALSGEGCRTGRRSPGHPDPGVCTDPGGYLGALLPDFSDRSGI